MLHKIVLVLTLVIGISSCRTVRELKSLSQCEFRTQKIIDMKLAGVNVQNYQSFSEVGLMEGTKLLQAIAKGSLPLNLVLNIEIRNPNDKLAALNYLEWIAEIEDIEIAKGVVNQRYEIQPNNGAVIMPINISSDLFAFFSKQEGRNLVSKALNVKDSENRPKNLILKVKPSISIGKGYIKYPGYIKVKQEF